MDIETPKIEVIRPRLMSAGDINYAVLLTGEYYANCVVHDCGANCASVGTKQRAMKELQACRLRLIKPVMTRLMS